MKLTPLTFLDLEPKQQLAVLHERGVFTFRWTCDEWGALFFILDGWHVMVRQDVGDDDLRIIPVGTRGPLFEAMLIALDEAVSLTDLGL
jgi:hypothetical protein